MIATSSLCDLVDAAATLGAARDVEQVVEATRGAVAAVCGRGDVDIRLASVWDGDPAPLPAADVGRADVYPIVGDSGLLGSVAVSSAPPPELEPVLEAVLAQAASALARIGRAAESPERRKLAHDLRAPLSGIQGLSEVLAEEQLSTEDVRRFAARIHEEAKRLGRIISERVGYDAL